MSKFKKDKFLTKEEKRREKIRLECLTLVQNFGYKAKDIVSDAEMLYDFVVNGPKAPEIKDISTTSANTTSYTFEGFKPWVEEPIVDEKTKKTRSKCCKTVALSG